MQASCKPLPSSPQLSARPLWHAHIALAKHSLICRGWRTASYTNWQENESVKSCGVGSAAASCMLTPNRIWKMLYSGPADSTCPAHMRGQTRKT